MFRSLASSLITFFAVILFAFTILFLWSGSEGIQFARNDLNGDRSTQAVIAEFQAKQKAVAAATDYDRFDPDMETDVDEGDSNSGDGEPVVVWISIPGFRGDYVEKAETPFLDELISDGAETNKMRPSFPCMTFPAHATMATGMLPSQHGIVADRIRLPDGEVIKEPMNRELLIAEPIWETATRQGIKTLVHDWPLSQNQAGENAAAHFLPSFNPDSTDEERLNQALETWRSASGGSAPAGDAPASDDVEMAEGDGEAMAPEGEPAAADPATAEPAEAGGDKVRLVMLRLTDILKAGLVNGPREDATYEAIAKTDAALKAFFDKVQAEWATLAPPNANLVIFISTDHGLAELDKNVNVSQLLGDEMMQNADIVAHDAIANLFFKDLPENEGEKKIFLDKFDGELSKRIYFRTIKKEELPEEWSYNHERTGDRVLVLKTGYSFVDETSDEPVFDPADGAGFFGGYGYPVDESIRMSGQVILSGIPNAPAYGDLGEIGQLSFHATVCKLLGIQPAEGAVTDTLELN
ncbi:MAG: alkaline phosphatase family protein [Verrucomicrobiales bacterium]|nr:alkaline phosphatase family protein [Verrucomicrobiales bacterium]